MKIDIQLFGGHGASSYGGRGRKSFTEKDSTSLISERERQQREVDEALSVFNEVNKEYGYQINDIKVSTLSGKDANNVLAYYENLSDSISVNKVFFDSEKLNNVYDDSVIRGFHPGRGSKSAMEATIAHELGHALTGKIAKDRGRNFDGIADEIVRKAKRDSGHRSASSLAAAISGYAKENSAEAIAEAFSDVYCNGKSAKKESKIITRTLKSYF